MFTSLEPRIRLGIVLGTLVVLATYGAALHHVAELAQGRQAALGWLSAAFLATLGMVAVLARQAALRQRTERDARDASALLRDTVENVGQGILVLDRALRVQVWNRRFLELRGLSPDSIGVGTPFESLVRNGRPLSVRGEQGTARVNGAVPQIAAGEPFVLDAVRDDAVELEICGQPIPSGRYALTYSDVTALRRSERTARDQAARLTAILDNVQDGIVTISEGGSIESFSAGAERLLGWRADEVLRRNVSMLMPDPHRSAHDSYVASYLRTGQRRAIGHPRDMEALHRNGALVPVEIAVNEMWLGERRLFVGVLRDNAERRRMQRIQNEFISTVSHELRTPLTSIVGALGLLKGGVGGEFPPQAQRLVDMAHDNGHRLVRLVNDFLDLEKMRAGKLEFRLAPHALGPLVRSATDANRAFAEGYGVELACSVPRDRDLLAYVDPERLQQVITNLISNAVKYSPRGGVVRIALAPEEEHARLTVHDDGPGIPPEFHARIFEKFAQADSSDARGRSGTGLGLSIVRDIVERLDGEIGFETSADRGTTFFVRLPLWRRQGAPHRALAPRSPRRRARPGSRVLVVEDDPDVVTVVRGLLEGAGYAVDVAGTGAAALAAADERRPDAILLDLQLPDRNGRGLVHEFRRRLAPNPPPVLIVSATFGAQEARDASALGAVECFEKPLDGPRLLAALDGVLAEVVA